MIAPSDTLVKHPYPRLFPRVSCRLHQRLPSTIERSIRDWTFLGTVSLDDFQLVRNSSSSIVSRDAHRRCEWRVFVLRLSSPISHGDYRQHDFVLLPLGKNSFNYRYSLCVCVPLVLFRNKRKNNPLLRPSYYLHEICVRRKSQGVTRARSAMSPSRFWIFRSRNPESLSFQLTVL